MCGGSCAERAHKAYEAFLSLIVHPQAELLYENGTLVEQLATCEPLLVGKTEVVALQVAFSEAPD